MKFMIIENNRIKVVREGTSIVNGEIDYIEGCEVGMEFIDGKWVHLPSIPTYEQARQQTIRLIQDAETLGETEEVERLKQEWEFEKSYFTHSFNI